MAVINFSERLAAKQEEGKFAEAHAQFMEVFHEATEVERQEIFESMELKDMDRYKAATNPIIVRLAMRKFN